MLPGDNYWWCSCTPCKLHPLQKNRRSGIAVTQAQNEAQKAHPQRKFLTILVAFLNSTEHYSARLFEEEKDDEQF